MFAYKTRYPRLLLMAALIAFGAAAMRAGDSEGREKLTGKWQPAEGQKAEYGTWTFEANDTGIRVVQEVNGQKVAEYECNTMGRECEIKEDGHSAKVSMWFNGPKLVEMRTRGSEVVKRRFLVTSDPDTLELEIIPIAPGGKSETVRFSRSQGEAQARQN